MTERPQIETTAPLVPEMPRTQLRADGGQKRQQISGASAVTTEADAPLVPDLS
jgi:hypothetical protein